MSEVPFERTVCACPDCISCCLQQPGCLVPGDVERIEKFLGEPVERHLAASPGALVGRFKGGKVETFRIPTIVPKSTETGRCLFLSAEGRCRIHAVAPFGCAYFDTHMGFEESQRRMSWGIYEQIKPEYQAFRDTLDPAASHNPRTYIDVE